MELNLYGISSMRIDKLKNRQVRRYILLASIIYGITVIVTYKYFPDQFSTHIIPHSDSAANSISLETATCYVFDQVDAFELGTKNIQIELQKPLENTDAPLTLQYELTIAETKGEAQCNKQVAFNGQGADWKITLPDTPKQRELRCKQTNGGPLILTCDDVEIANGESLSKVTKAFKIVIPKVQEEFSVIGIDYQLKLRSVEYSSTLSKFKYAFSIVTAIVLYLYWKQIRNFQPEDLGFIQKWITILLIELIFFNEPLLFLKSILPFNLYPLLTAGIQATFIAMLLFFWLVVTHSISETELVTVDERRFYMPKVILTGAIWVSLLLTLCYVSLQQARDASFNWREDIDTDSLFYSTVRVISIILISLYASYFVLVAYVSFFQANTFKEMKKSYKISLLLTFGVISACITLLIVSGYNARVSGPLKYISFAALLNIYLWLIAFLYSPSVDGLEDIQFKQARKEHEHIMNQFYEQELPDISGKDTSLVTENDIQMSEGPVKQGGAEKRGRYLKKDPKEKAKEKLWDSIVKETEDEASSSESDDSDHI